MVIKTGEQGRAELLPCPFCGGDEIAINTELSISYVDCDACDTQGPVVEGSPAAAIAAWNRRAALQSQDRDGVQFLQEDDQHALHRFIETTEDGEGYDIGKDRIKRLADLGVVSNQGFGRYSVTMFGYWCHERYWHQNPSLPLKTIDEHNAQAAIDYARRVEGDGE